MARRITLITRLLQAIPGKERFGIYRLMPFFYLFGASIEFFMIHWRPNGVNFCKKLPFVKLKLFLLNRHIFTNHGLNTCVFRIDCHTGKVSYSRKQRGLDCHGFKLAPDSLPITSQMHQPLSPFVVTFDYILVCSTN